MMKKYGRSSFTLPQDSPNGFTALSQTALLHNSSLEAQVDSWIEECNSTCWGHNCIRVNFSPLVTSTMEHEKYVGFQLFDQNGPETRIAFVGKLSLVNFLVYILSIVGVWLGISCLDISKNVIHLVSRIQAIKWSINCCKWSNGGEENAHDDETRTRGNICLNRTLATDRVEVRNVPNQFVYPREQYQHEHESRSFINRRTFAK